MKPVAPFKSVADALECLTTDLEEREIVQRGVDVAQAATGSRIAYLHFLNEDQSTIELGVWSSDTQQICTAVYDRHYPIDHAGIWADSARTRSASIQNDYAAASGKRGLPEGHVSLTRHLGVPVIDEGIVRLLVGVGNKSAPYDEDDVAMLDRVSRRIWSVMRQRRELERLLDMARRFRHVQQIASVCGFEYDLDEDKLTFDEMAGVIFRLQDSSCMPRTLREFLALVAPKDQEAVRRAFGAGILSRQFLRIDCQLVAGECFPADLKIEFRPREVGRGVIGVGILQDLSDLVAVEDLRRRADSDPLTGLPNRNSLQSYFQHGLGRRGSGDGVAFHYIDLDDFKPVNDSYGHPVGDEVLKVVAQRLLQSVRKDDLVVRMGGDEFVTIQTGLEDPAAAEVLAGKIIASISQPIVVRDLVVHVGASIGIALCLASTCNLHKISSAADRALYQAKTMGGQRYVVLDDAKSFA